MQDYDLNTEEGRKQHAIAHANLPSVKDPGPGPGQRIQIRYIDCPPMPVMSLDEPMSPTETVNTGMLIYEYSVGSKGGWVLVEALSYRELQSR